MPGAIAALLQVPQESVSMVDKKDVPPRPAGRRSLDAPGSTAKRTFSTIDLKATEVAGATSESGKPAQDAPTADPGSNPSNEPPASTAEKPAVTSSDEFAESAARIAAAAARAGQEPGAAAAGPQAHTADRADRGSKPRFEDQGFAIERYVPMAFVTYAGAGLVGGVIALLGAFLLTPEPPTALPAADSVIGPELATRVAALEQAAKKPSAARIPNDAEERIRSLEAAIKGLDTGSQDVETLKETQARLATDVNALRSSIGQEGRSDDAGARIGKLEQQVGAMSAAADADPQAASRMGALAQITTRLAELESSVAARLATQRKEQSQEMEVRVASVSEASEAARTGIQRLDRDLTSAKAEISRTSQRADVLKAAQDRVDQSVRALQADEGGLKTSFEEFKADTDARLRSLAKPADIAAAVTPLQGRLSTLDQSVQSVMQAEDERKANAERVVLALELGSLKRALERGGNYAAELTAVKKAGAGRIDLTALEAYQYSGLPAQAELVRDFRAVANAILDADAEPADASLVDRLLSGARTIVRVRKVAPADDDKSTEAIVARMETAVRDGRLNDVIDEARHLPAKAAVPAHDWLKKIEARRAVDAGVAKIDATLKASLAPGSPGQPGTKQ